MKKIVLISVFASVVCLTGCSGKTENNNVPAIASSYSASAISERVSELDGAPSSGSGASISASEPEIKPEYPDIVCTVSWNSEDNAPVASSNDTSESETGTKIPHIVYSSSRDDAGSVPAASSGDTSASGSEPGIPHIVYSSGQGSSNGSSAPSSSGNAPAVSEPVSVSGSISNIKKICGLKSKVETSIDACIVDTYNGHNPYDVAYDYGKDYDAFVSACDWSLVFDADFYIESFPLLAMQYHNDKALLLEHFRTIGIHEGRQGNKNFNVGVYKANCKSNVKNAFGDNWEGYYFYYMLNYGSEKSVNTSSGSKLQQKTTMTALQAAELKGVNMYRKEVGVFEIKFDEELAAYANYRAYLNSHDGWKAHDWFEADEDITNSIMRAYNASSMGENTTTQHCNTSNCTSHRCNYGETSYEYYRKSESHYKAMIAEKNDLIGCGNCYKAAGVVSQFDAFINL